MTDNSNHTEPQMRRPGPPEGPFVPLVGLVVVAVGVIFLLGNFGFALPLPDRWWALFILIPAIGAVVAAIRFYRQDGRMSGRVTGPLTGGLLMLATATILFFDLPWGRLWPVMVIIAGLGILARGYGRRR